MMEQGGCCHAAKNRILETGLPDEWKTAAGDGAENSPSIWEKQGFLFFDVLYCGVAYGAGYQDYWLYEFEKLTRAQRRTYVTRGFNNRMVCLLNDKEKRSNSLIRGILTAGIKILWDGLFWI